MLRILSKKSAIRPGFVFEPFTFILYCDKISYIYIVKWGSLMGEKIVVKVGTSTLTYENGRLNLRRMENLCKILCDLQNRGNKLLLVSSGAIGVGMGKLALPERPKETKQLQALAAVGQCELMFMYDKFFGEYNHTVAQILLTKHVVETQHKQNNVINTVETLFDMNILPIVNENDTVAIDELPGENFGDNYMLSAMVASMIHADRLIILSDIDGLYDKNPKEFPDARLITSIPKIDDTIFEMAADGAGSNRGTGGMKTKLSAALHATEAGITCSIINGSRPENLYDLIENNAVGTTFAPQK